VKREKPKALNKKYALLGADATSHNILPVTEHAAKHRESHAQICYVVGNGYARQLLLKPCPVRTN